MRTFDKIIGAVLFGLFCSIWIPGTTLDEQTNRGAIWMVSCVAGIFLLLIIRVMSGFYEDSKNMHLRNPEDLYQSELTHYHHLKDLKNQFMLPSPYHYQYKHNPVIWEINDYWQNQWRLYTINRPSVYNSPSVIPHGDYFSIPSKIPFCFWDSDGQLKWCAPKTT